MYGPTETTTFASSLRVTEVEEGALSVPIGYAIGATDLLVADRWGRRLPIGGDRRAPDRRRRRGPRLPPAACALGREVRAASRVGRAGRPDVPQRRPGAAPAFRRARLPRPHRPAGQDPRLPHRAGRDRGGARPVPGGGPAGGGGARRRPRQQAPGRLPGAQGRRSDRPRRRCASSSAAACPTTTCLRPTACSTSCRSPPTARPTAAPCRPSTSHAAELGDMGRSPESPTEIALAGLWEELLGTPAWAPGRISSRSAAIPCSGCS